jgi:prevent-host-death family protein
MARDCHGLALLHEIEKLRELGFSFVNIHLHSFSLVSLAGEAMSENGFMEVDVGEAKIHLSDLLEKVEQGEEVTIMRANVPVATLTAVTPSSIKLELGWARGEFTVPENFDDPLPTGIEESFCR